MNIHFREIKPSPALQPYVECFWMQTFSEATGQLSQPQRCMPFGTMEIIIHLDNNCTEVYFDGQWSRLPRIFLAGLYLNPVIYRANGNTRKYGIRLKPEIFHLLFRAPSAALYSNYTLLENIIGSEANDFADQLSEAGSMEEIVAHTEAFLIRQLRRQDDCHDPVIEATRIIRSAKGNISVEELSKSVYVSLRKLQRGFRDVMGTSPKMYMRITRFRNAYASMQHLEKHGGWTGLSYDSGYFDQAHFIREFKEFTGMVPKVIFHSNEKVSGRY